MNKNEFLAALGAALGKLPEQEVRASLEFYAEAIDDRMEDGATEEEAVAAMGDVAAIAAQIEAETPPIPKAVARMSTGSHMANVILAVVLSPIWVPLALAFAACVACVYLALWALVAALWAVAGTLVLCGPIGVAGLVYCMATGYPLTGAWLLGTGLVACGLGLLSLPAMRAASVGLVRLARLFASATRRLFVREEAPRPTPQGHTPAESGPRPAPPAGLVPVARATPKITAPEATVGKESDHDTLS